MALLCAQGNWPARRQVCYCLGTERDRGREGGRLLRVALRGAHLTALCALAFAQPLFDILGKNPAFFAVRGSSGREIVLFALALTLLPPAALIVVELVAELANRVAARILHLVLVAGLVAVIVLHALTNNDALSGVGALAVAAALGLAGGALYARAQAVRTFMTFLPGARTTSPSAR